MSTLTMKTSINLVKESIGIWKYKQSGRVLQLFQLREVSIAIRGQEQPSCSLHLW